MSEDGAESRTCVDALRCVPVCAAVRLDTYSARIEVTLQRIDRIGVVRERHIGIRPNKIERALGQTGRSPFWLPWKHMWQKINWEPYVPFALVNSFSFIVPELPLVSYVSTPQPFRKHMNYHLRAVRHHSRSAQLL